MPVQLSIDHPSPIFIKTVFGNFGTIGIDTGKGIAEAPVVFGCIRVVGDYQILVDRAETEYYPKGRLVLGFCSTTGYGDFQELPIVEVFLGKTGSTVSEYFVRQGWAVPDEALFTTCQRHDQYVAALKDARREHAGIWAEGMDAAAIGLSPELDHLTAPILQPPAWVSHVFIVGVLVIAGVLGWRERYWRERLKEQSHDGKPRPRAALLRSMGGAYLGLFPGIFKPLPLKPVLESPAPPAAASTSAPTRSEP